MEKGNREGQMDSQSDTQRPQRIQSRRLWWLLPVAVLFILLAVIYVLGRMSSADSEMYPTTQRQGTMPARSS